MSKVGRTAHVYQLDDWMRFRGSRLPLECYYHANRIPVAELDAGSDMEMASWLVMASMSRAWYEMKMRPMRAGDLIVVTAEIPERSYMLVHGRERPIPGFSHLSLQDEPITHDELRRHHATKSYLAVSAF